MLMTGSGEWLHLQSSLVLRCLQLMSVLLTLSLYTMIQIFIAKVVSKPRVGVAEIDPTQAVYSGFFFPMGFWP